MQFKSKSVIVAMIMAVLAIGTLAIAVDIDSDESDATTLTWKVGEYNSWTSSYRHDPDNYVADIVGSLPPGLSKSYASNLLIISGTPTTAGTYTVTIEVIELPEEPYNASVQFVIQPAAVEETYTHVAKLKFNLNGGTGSFSDMTRSITSVSSSPSGSYTFKIPSTVPTREGYKFSGWSSSGPTSTVGSHSPGSTWSVNYGSTSTFYAIWTAVEKYAPTITYDANGGLSSFTETFETTSTTAQQVTISGTVPIRNNYEFLGWGDSISATSAGYHAGDKISLSYNETKTLYAVWKAVEYTCTLTYDANGGVNAPISSTYTGTSTDNHAFTITTEIPSKEGYTFLGWSDLSNSTSASYHAGETVDVHFNGTKILYAVWKTIPAESTITYDANGGTASADVTTPAKVLSGNSYTLLTKGFAKTGHYLSSWNTAADGSGISYDIGQTITISSDHTLYAQWTALPHTNDKLAPTSATVGVLYSYKPDTAGDNDWWIIKSVISSSTVTFTSYPDWLTTRTVTANSIIFSGTPGPDDVGVHTVNLTAKYTNGESWSISWIITVSPANEGTNYTISFNTNGGTGTLYSQYGTADTIVTLPGFSVADVTKPGYTLGGWSTTIDGTMVIYPLGSIYTIHSNKTFSAHWVADTNVIVFDVNGGTGETAYQTADTDSLVTLPDDGYTRSGYTLNGWYISSDPTTIYALGYTYKVSATTVFKAYWVEIGTTTVAATFNANGGVGGFTMNVESGKNVVMPIYGITFSGNELQKWNTATDGSGTSYAMGSTATITGATTFYAQWIPGGSTTFTITFNLNGGQGSVAPQVLSSGNTVDEPNAPTRHGYLFSGWRVVGGSAWDFASVVSNSMTLEAQWTKLAGITADGTTITLTIASGYISGTSTITWGDGSENSTGVSEKFTHDYKRTSSGIITISVNLAGDSYTTTLPYSVTSTPGEGGNDGGNGDDGNKSGMDWKKIVTIIIAIVLGIILLTRVI